MTMSADSLMYCECFKGDSYLHGGELALGYFLGEVCQFNSNTRGRWRGDKIGEGENHRFRVGKEHNNRPVQFPQF